MSERLHLIPPGSESTPKPADKDQQPPRADFPSRLEPAGNAALARAVEHGGKELPPEVRARVEQAYGMDFGNVRVRDDAAAREASQSLGAEAFVHGENVYLGPAAPPLDSPEAVTLLAHEVAHVAQQRQATVIEGGVSEPGDALEQQASGAAQQAVSGQKSAVGGGGATPAVQRQPTLAPRRQTGATRTEVEQALLAFLRRVLAMRPAPDLRRSRVVRNALDTLVLRGGPSAMFVNVDDFLSRVPNEPVEFARRFARLLPETIDRAAIERLNQLAVADSPTGSAASRAGELFSQTKAAEMPPPPGAARETPAEEADRIAAVQRRWAGVEEPTTVGPVPVDVLQLPRLFRGLPQAIHPRTPQPPAPEARNYPEVEAAVQRIPPDALVPAEARGGERATSFADAREFARDLARQLDLAQQRGQDTITLNLGDIYNQARDRQAMRAAVEEIIAQIRAALPHHASGVTNVDVYFGRNLVTRGRARRSE